MLEQIKALVTAYLEDENTSVEDIAELLESALHPEDAEKLATNLVDRIAQCECGNTVYDSATECDKCGAQFEVETETDVIVNQVVATPAA